LAPATQAKNCLYPFKLHQSNNTESIFKTLLEKHNYLHKVTQ